MSKGSTPRPCNGERFSENYDRIFRKKYNEEDLKKFGDSISLTFTGPREEWLDPEANYSGDPSNGRVVEISPEGKVKHVMRKQ